MRRGGLTLDINRVRRHAMDCGRVALELQLRRLVADLRCAEHGGQAIITVAPAASGEWEVKVSGCCDRFVEEARAMIEV